jgi:biotin carboxyl carrier protein
MWMKKRYVLKHADEQFTAVVARDRDGRIAVQIGDGELREVDARWVQNGRALSLRVDGRMHLIDLTAHDEPGHLEATVNGRFLDLLVMDELRARAHEAQAQVGGGGRVCAEIPGLVMSVLTTVGAAVRRGEPLLVLEAMKMQNEIGAPLDGVVAEVLVREGQSVNLGDALLVIEPAAD